MTYFTTPPKLNVTVGTVFARVSRGTGRYEPTVNFDYTVTRVTPSGRFEATQPGRLNPLTGQPEVLYFNAQGYELEGSLNGTVKRYGSEADLDCAKWEARLLNAALARNARDALNNVKLAEPARDTWGKESMVSKLAELENLMALARAAVEAM